MTKRLLAPLAIAAGVTLAITGCSAGTGANTSGSQAPVVDGTFAWSLNADPGSLNPLMTAGSPTHQLAMLSYDFLVNVDDKTSEIGPWLAESWEETTTSASFTIRDGVTCSDGSALTAQTVADNISFVTDEANGSALRGVYVPVDAAAAVDGATVTVSTPAASPFLLLNLARLPILCDAALADPKSIDASSAGSGMFAVTEAVANDHYTFERRDGYSWGPDDTTSETPGVPATVVVSIVTNESTAANQLLSGELNAALVTGADQDRLDAAGLNAAERGAIAGQMFFNHNEANPTSDPAVRAALVQGLNLDDLTSVITGGRGHRSTSLVSTNPRACVDDTVTGNLPSFDADAAGAALDAAGWKLGADGTRAKNGTPLALNFFYDSMGDTYDAAADLTQQAWTALGIDVTLTSGDSNKTVEVLLSGTDNTGWDVAWEPVYVNLPSMVVPFFSGPVPADGLNFSGIENAEYDAAVATASGLVGAEACSAWADAEKALFAETSVVPFADTVKKTYLQNAELAFGSQIVGSALRLLK
ncbi:ABC transporter substrate-binding protein [Microterricola viridarii]|uniref:Peptide/nickel transport system substrate-binding protein n=1 Tax=Microterricola viridarii TaxID=412690 RepID=A0A1H1YH93_9MICO|nr:ABC transporter substrate-binding protein [Microterricola viridarii]SDT20751.1 peptide/nickel transport system substrate-binding protein [Microterricola viridarii]